MQEKVAGNGNRALQVVVFQTLNKSPSGSLPLPISSAWNALMAYALQPAHGGKPREDHIHALDGLQAPERAGTTCLSACPSTSLSHSQLGQLSLVSAPTGALICLEICCLHQTKRSNEVRYAVLLRKITEQ